MGRIGYGQRYWMLLLFGSRGTSRKNWEGSLMAGGSARPPREQRQLPLEPRRFLARNGEVNL